jgi:hypothetical protein
MNGPKKDVDTCREEAKRLSKQHKFFRWPKNSIALVGWRRYGGRCAYCDKNLMADWESLSNSANTDHLLPRKYKELIWDEGNLVPVCSLCNSVKKHYDANIELPVDQPPERGGRYTAGPLTEQQHDAIVELCRQKVSKLRSKRQDLMASALACWNDFDGSNRTPAG